MQHSREVSLTRAALGSIVETAAAVCPLAQQLPEAKGSSMTWLEKSRPLISASPYCCAVPKPNSPPAAYSYLFSSAKRQGPSAEHLSPHACGLAQGRVEPTGAGWLGQQEHASQHGAAAGSLGSPPGVHHGCDGLACCAPGAGVLHSRAEACCVARARGQHTWNWTLFRPQKSGI
jgi:hypothetical protein